MREFFAGAARALLIALACSVPAAWGIAADLECNGVLSETGASQDPPPLMECLAIDCAEGCGDPKVTQLSGDTLLFYCSCGSDSEPTCCHTIQKSIGGVMQTPYGWGLCRTSAGCNAGTCQGTLIAGFTCQ